MTEPRCARCGCREQLELRYFERSGGLFYEIMVALMPSVVGFLLPDVAVCGVCQRTAIRTASSMRFEPREFPDTLAQTPK